MRDWQPKREDFVRSSRLRFATSRLWELRIAPHGPCELWGDVHHGGHFVDENPDGIAIAWCPEGVVVLCYDHERDYDITTDTREVLLSLEERNPRKFLIGMPPELEPALASLLAQPSYERLATVGFWWTAGATKQPYPYQDEDGLEMMNGFLASVAPYRGIDCPWRPGSLSDDAFRTLHDILMRAEQSVVQIAPEEQAQLLPNQRYREVGFDGRLLEPVDPTYDRSKLEALEAAFLKLGVSWPTLESWIDFVNDPMSERD